MMESESHPFFQPIETKARIDECSCCREKSGNIISKINYIGLVDVDLVQCPNCALTSFDPIPSSETTRLGCTLLYRSQQTETDKKKILRGFARSYRRGGRFARKYLRSLDYFKENKKHVDILEIGAGDGYFSQGVISQFSSGKVTYVDIVDELKSYYDQHFSNHDAVTGEFSSKIVKDKKFDLLIIRDLLEHLRDPSKFLEDAQKVLKDQGYIFIITPNGWEDAWPAYQYASFRDLAKLQQNPFVIYLNHFHYFMPSTLTKLLADTGFTISTSFKFGLKRFRSGLGHRKQQTSDMHKPDLKKYEKEQESFLKHWSHEPNFIKGEILHNNSFISRIYSSVSDREKEREEFNTSRGHEFFILAQKK